MILERIFEMYLVVSVPGLIPGMYPFCLLRFFDISSGLTAATNVYPYVNAIIRRIYTTNPIGVVVVKYLVMKDLNPSLFIKYVRVVGIASTADAKITGISV